MVVRNCLASEGLFEICGVKETFQGSNGSWKGNILTAAPTVGESLSMEWLAAKIMQSKKCSRGKGDVY